MKSELIWRERNTLEYTRFLKDHTSWFIAADFDGNKARDEAYRVLEILENYSLPVYMERSRSGAGIHLWMFFESPYPAYRSRKFLLHILQQAGVISEFDKNSGFDRLFPSQDRLAGKGLGNLIALPLQRRAMQSGNCCFLNPETFEPWVDQWEFLSQIRSVPIARLDQIFKSFQSAPNAKAIASIQRNVKVTASTQTNANFPESTQPYTEVPPAIQPNAKVTA